MSQPKKHARKPVSRNATLPHQKLWKGLLTLTAKASLQEHPDLAQPFLDYLRNDDWPGLYKYSETLSTRTYESPQDHFCAIQLSALVLKYPAPKNIFGFDHTPRETAVAKFHAAEEKCRISNNRFVRWSQDDRVKKTPYSVQMEYMRRWIATVLGKLDMEAIYDNCSFGDGSNVGVHGNKTHLAVKLLSEWTCTEMNRDIAIRALWRNDQLRYGILSGFSTSEIVSYDPRHFETCVLQRIKAISFNMLSFVPKTAKTDRSIAIEPVLNTYTQKGVDHVMREKLRVAGYDLTDQSRNQQLAKSGSVYDDLCTIDLSSASDSMSTWLVRSLLPPDWLWLLSCTRSPAYLLNGEVIRYQKFVSMGNGFCFPLQTLLFAAAVRASISSSHCRDTRHSVYGDDIIVPKQAFDDTVKLLAFMGFKTNSEKTFKNGPFRESCGADWYLGQDVRPVYLDFLLSASAEVRIFHNATLRSEIVSDLFKDVRDYLRSVVPSKELLLRPIFRSNTYDSYKKKKLSIIELRNLNGAFSVDLDTFMGSRTARWNRDEFRWNWTEVLYTRVEDTVQYRPLCRYLLFLSGNAEGKGALRFTAKARLVVR